MKSFLLAILLFCGTIAYPQDRRLIDSLKHQLILSQKDTNGVLIMANLSEGYINSRPDSARLYGQQALELANQLDFFKGRIRALNALGNVYSALGNIPKGLELFFNALRIAKDKQYLNEAAFCYNNIGYAYRDLKDNYKAILYFQQGAKICQKIQDIKSEADINFGISSVFIELNRYDSALVYANKVYRKFDSLQRLNKHVSIYGLLGLIQRKLGNNSLSLYYLRKNLQISTLNNSHLDKSYTCFGISRVFKNMNQLDSCFYYAELAYYEAKLINSKIAMLRSSAQLAEDYEPTDLKKSIYYYKIAKRVKDELYGPDKIQSLQKLVLEQQERQRQAEAKKIAYQNQVKQYALLAGLGALLLIALILYRNNHQKQKANALLHRQKEEIDFQRHLSEQTLSELRATQTQLIQREKMASLGELTAGVAHEIQNPLNFVNNFSELSVELIQEQKETLAKGEVEEAQLIADDLSQNLQKITHHGKRASNIIKGMLEHARTPSDQKEPTDLNALADEYLRLAYQGWLQSGRSAVAIPAKDKNGSAGRFRADIVTDFATDLGLVNIVPQEIGRVLLNLYNNAFYALQQKQKTAPPDYKPTLNISTRLIRVDPLNRPERVTSRSQSNGLRSGIPRIEIRVRDNGTGIPETVKDKVFQPFFTTKPTGEGTGLGLSLSYDIITKGHSGSLDVKTVPGEFTEFSILLPIV